MAWPGPRPASLAERGGYRLALVDNRADALEETLSGVRALGAEALGITVDLGDAEQVESVVPQTCWHTSAGWTRW